MENNDFYLKVSGKIEIFEKTQKIKKRSVCYFKMNKKYDLKADEKLENILGKLKPYTTKELPISKHSFRRLNLKTITYLHDQLNKNLEKTINNSSRPICPAENFLYANKARAPYKNEMGNYISQWGINFNNNISIPFNVFEALANYLESKTN